MLIDIVFAILLIMACIKGFQKGLIIAVFSIVAFIIGLAAALKLSTAVASWLGNSVSVNTKWLPFISFALVFFIVILLVQSFFSSFNGFIIILATGSLHKP